MDDIHHFIMNDLWSIVSSKHDKAKKLNLIVEEIARFLRLEKCSLMVEENGKFTIVASVGIPKKVITETEVIPGEGVSGMAIKEKKAVYMRKISVLSHRELWNEYKTDNFISYPIESNGEIIAVLNLTDRRDNIGFSEKDLENISPIIERIKFVLEM